MKHLKKYKLFESTTSELNDEIMDALVHIQDHGYEIKIYDYFNNAESRYLFKNKASITETTSNMKLIKISKDGSNIESFSIDDFKELGYSSSGFTFIKDFSKMKEFFLELLESVSQLIDYDPKICLDGDDVLVLLTMGKSDIDPSGLRAEYDKLSELLSSVPKNVGIKDVTIFSDSKTLFIKINRREGNDSKVLANLCKQMSSNPAYDWMDQEEEILELKKIRDEINKDGYNITFKSNDSYENTYTLILTEK